MQSLKLSAVGLIAMILAGGGCSAVSVTPDREIIDSGTTKPVIPDPFDTASLIALYENSSDYKCSSEGRACVNAETPYYSAKIARDSSDSPELSKTLINVWADGTATALPFSQLLPEGSGYVCVIKSESESENCAGSSAPIAVNFDINNRGTPDPDNNEEIIGNILPSDYKDKIVFYFYLNGDITEEIGNRLAIASIQSGFDGANLYVGTDLTHRCASASFTPCIDIPHANFDNYEGVTVTSYTPALLATLRAGQLFSMFPAVSNNIVRDMLLAGGGDCIVHLRCFLIAESFSPSQQDLYENPLDYSCGGRACVNAETPYYSARIANGGLSKILLNVWGDDGVGDRFLQLLPEGSGYYCTLTTENYYCADSPAPIAVNLSSAYRGENLLPGNYADKVIVMNLLGEEYINSQGDRLIITSAKQTNDRISLRVGIGISDNTCVVTDVNCVNVPLSNFSDYADSDNKYLLPVALAGLRATQLFTLFPGAPNVVVRNTLKNENCLLYLRCLAIGNSVNDRTPPWSFELTFRTLKDLYENPSLYHCSASDACVNAETPYYSYLVARDSSAPTKMLTKILLNVWADGTATALPFSQLLPEGSGYYCTLTTENYYCAESDAPIAVNLSSAYRGGNLLPGNYADKVTVMNLLSEEYINSQGDRLIITPATDVSEKLKNVAKAAFSKISLRVGTDGDNTCPVADVNCVNVPSSNFSDYADNIPNKYLLPVTLAGLRAAQLFTLFPDALNVVVRDVIRNTNCLLYFRCLAIMNKFAGDAPWSFALDSYPLKTLYENPSFYPCSASGRTCVNAETPYYSARVVEGNLSKTLVNLFTDKPSLTSEVLRNFLSLLPSDSGYVCVLGAAEGADENCSNNAPIAVNPDIDNRGTDDGTGVITGNILPSDYKDKVVFYLYFNSNPTKEEIGGRLAISLIYLGFPGASLYVSDPSTCGMVLSCIDISLANYKDVGNGGVIPPLLATLRAGQLFTLFPDAPNVVVRDMLNATCIVSFVCLAITNKLAESTPYFFDFASYTLKVLYENPSFYPCSSNADACVNAETPYYSARITNKGLTKILLNVWADGGATALPFSQLLPEGSGYICTLTTENYYCADSPAPIAVNLSSAYRVSNLPSAYKDKVTVMNLLSEDWIDAQGERLIITPATDVSKKLMNVAEAAFSKISLRVGTDGDNTCTATDVNCVNVPLSNFDDYADNIPNRYLLPVALAGLRAAQLFTLFPGAPNVVVRDTLKNMNCILYLQCSAIIRNDYSLSSLSEIYASPGSYDCGGQSCVNAETPYYSALVAEGADSDLTKTLVNILLNATSVPAEESLLFKLVSSLLPSDSGYVCVIESESENCSRSSAPIAVNYSLANRGTDDGTGVITGNILPSNYADKVVFYFKSSRDLTEAEEAEIGDLLIITGARFPINGSHLRVGVSLVNGECDVHPVIHAIPCIDISDDDFNDYGALPSRSGRWWNNAVLVTLRAGQLFTMFPNASNNTVVDMLLNKKADGTTDTKCIVLLQCLAIADSFTTSSSGEAGSSGEASSTTGASASSGSASSAGSGSASSAGSANSFIADIGSMTTYGKRQVFWSDGGLSVETRSHKIYRGGAHAMALAYRSMMGTLDITTGWTSQSSALGMEQMFLSGSSLGVFGALRYDVGSYLGMRPYVGLVASWHSMLETPKNITIMTANEVHVRAGVDVDVKGMRFALEGRCGQHQRLIGYGALSSALAETSCSTHLKASVSF